MDAMQLTEAQAQVARGWLSDGLKLSDFQKRVEKEFGLRLTYMDTRLLVDDLRVVPKDIEPPKAPEPAPAPATAPATPASAQAYPVGNVPGQGGFTPSPMGQPATAPAPAPAPGGGGVSVTVDAITRPGALASGSVTFSDAQKAEIGAIAQSVAIVMAPNMSVGVNVVLRLLDVAARALNEGYDIEVIEAHHRHKVDAPSGTALKMGEVLAHALGRDLKACGVFAREGVTGERDPSTIGFSTIRGGDIVGDHTVLFAGTGERIEISHRSSSRAGYAQGSLRAARFLSDKPSGLYGMNDVLGM